MSNTNTGGWAFPAPAGCGEDNGMTLRDYFAAKALPAVIQHCERERWAWAAQRSYEIADAMLAERKKQ